MEVTAAGAEQHRPGNGKDADHQVHVGQVEDKRPDGPPAHLDGHLNEVPHVAEDQPVKQVAHRPRQDETAPDVRPTVPGP